MADFHALEALINAYIKQNGVQAITGQVLNGVLRGMVSALGKGWTVAGQADPTTDPGTMTGPVAYIAHEAGTYTHFGGLVVDDGEVAFLKYDEQTWTKETLASLVATASVDGNVGTPSVTTQFVNGVLNFAFHNLKGNPGEDGTDGHDGAAAGFGTVDATVDNTVGTPAVSVQSSGPNTAKNFAFSFTGLKGETGVTSVVVTVDNTSGSPACTASLVSGVLTLAFTGLKGAQGDPGSSLDYPFTLVNNLTTNDATQALTAAMGYQLEGEITQLEHKVDGLNTETKTAKDISSISSVARWITNTAKWNSGSGAAGKFIPITPGKKYGVLYTNTGGSHCGVLKSDTATINSTPDFATGYSGRTVCTDDVEFVFTAPNDAHYLFLLTQFSNTPFSVTLYEYGTQHTDGLIDDVDRIDGEIVGIQSDISSLESSVEKINVEIDGVPESVYILSSYTQNKGTANNDGTWSSYGSSNYKHIAIPVTVGSKLEIVAGNTYRARYGFLSQYSAPSADNTIVHFAPDCVCETVNIGETVDVIVPDGATYMYVETLQNGTDCTPDSITDLGKKSKVESLQYAFQVDFNAYDDTIISSAFAYKSAWYIVPSTGKWNVGADNGGISIPVFDAQKMMVKGSSYSLAFLKSNIRTSGSVAPFCKGFNGVIAGTEDKMFDIPSDCRFVYFRRLINNVNSLPDSCTLYFEKTEAVQKRRPIVSFVDDDAWKEQLEWLEPIVMATSVPITIALITTAVGSTNYCTWEELRRFRNIGFKFVAHGATNITTMDVEDIEAMFISTQSAMESHGMLDSDMFVLPNGAIDNTTRPVVENYFKCSYSTNQKVNVIPLSDKYIIRRISIDSGSASLSSWKQWVDYAVKTRGWVIFYGHARGENYDDAMRTAYIELINYCKSNGVTILSLPDAWKECSLLTAND